jgi:hypothetical protein
LLSCSLLRFFYCKKATTVRRLSSPSSFPFFGSGREKNFLLLLLSCNSAEAQRRR